MSKRRSNIILGVLAAIVVVIALLVAGSAWLIVSVFHRQQLDASGASAAFAVARARFTGVTPVFEVEPDGPVMTRPIPSGATGVKLHTMHFLSWNPVDRRMSQADVPVALLRLRDDPINFLRFANGADRYPTHRVVAIRFSELERFGSTLLLDQTLEDGRRVLVWTE